MSRSPREKMLILAGEVKADAHVWLDRAHDACREGLPELARSRARYARKAHHRFLKILRDTDAIFGTAEVVSGIGKTYEH